MQVQVFICLSYVFPYLYVYVDVVVSDRECSIHVCCREARPPKRWLSPRRKARAYCTARASLPGWPEGQQRCRRSCRRCNFQMPVEACLVDPVLRISKKQNIHKYVRASCPLYPSKLKIRKFAHAVPRGARPPRQRTICQIWKIWQAVRCKNALFTVKMFFWCEVFSLAWRFGCEE